MTSQKKCSAQPCNGFMPALETTIEDRIAEGMIAECKRARSIYPPFHNAHEGYAVLLEEVEELWEAVRLKQSDPEREKRILEETNQIGAMAIRIMIDCRDVPAFSQ